MTGGECLYHMPTTTIFGYCVFDQVIDLADEAATELIEEEMANYLDGTGANYTVVSADVAEASWFEGDTIHDIVRWGSAPIVPVG